MTMNGTATILAGGVVVLAAGLAWADSHEAEGEAMDHGGHGTMDMSAMPAPMQGMMETMDGMMAAMPTESTGMVDADFLLMMIPHHRSAVDMARIELEEGLDEETRALAREIIDAQEAEIEEMRAMLGRMGVEAPGAG